MATLPYSYDSQKFFLYSVNILLQGINELPIADESDFDTLVEAQLAATTLEETKRNVLAEGWDFNRDNDYQLSPNLDGFIVIPANILDLSSTDGRYIMRDWKLYDRRSGSTKFDAPVKVDIVWDMDFNSLTHPLRNYITMKASRTFQYRTIGDQSQYQFTAEDVNQAYMSAKHSDSKTARYNIKNSNYGLNFGRLR